MACWRMALESVVSHAVDRAVRTWDGFKFDGCGGDGNGEDEGRGNESWNVE
jgi:hypothetical protein